MTIGVHPTNDGLFSAMLTFGVGGGLSLISVFTLSTSMDQKKTMIDVEDTF
jgi:hypothetical protein